MHEPEASDDIHQLDGVDFDPSALARQVGEDRSVLAELFGLYADTCSEGIHALRSALERCDREIAFRQAHKLCSSSNSVGAIALGALCARIEAMAPTAEPSQLVALSAELDRESGRALAWIEDMARSHQDERA